MTDAKSQPISKTWVAVLVLLLVLVTRAISLTYQIDIHPDEYKFARSTDSLMNAILEPGTDFVEEKEYPEGAYYFHLPFHLAGLLLEKLTRLEYDMAVCGRVSSVFYFCLAVLLGMKLLVKHMKAQIPAQLLFGLSMCFSLFFLEHSHYGTGDMISLFLIFLIIDLSAEAAGHGFSGKYLYPAWFLSGVLGAVKYPLLLFSVIPLSVYLYSSRSGLKGKLAGTGLFLLLTLSGLLLWSPKAITDPGYFVRVIEREISAYVSDGTTFEAGGLLNHIAAMVIYPLLYSDFPLSSMITAGLFIALALSFAKKRKAGETVSGEEFLLWTVVPGLCTVFFVYNLFPKLLIFRTYTPFFGLSVLYSSYALGKIWKMGGWKRSLIGVLSLLMILRGGVLTWVMSSEDRARKGLMEQIETAVDENWSSTVIISPYVITLDRERFKNLEVEKLQAFLEKRGGDPSMEAGMLVITGAYEHALSGRYILPIVSHAEGNLSSAELNYLWSFFKEINGVHYVGQSYPDWYYYLFGGWIRGSTLSTTVIPCNQIYYRSA